MDLKITVSVAGKTHSARAHVAFRAVVDGVSCPHCGTLPLQVQGTGEAVRVVRVERDGVRRGYYVNNHPVAFCCGGSIDWIRADFDPPPIEEERVSRR